MVPSANQTDAAQALADEPASGTATASKGSGTVQSVNQKRQSDLLSRSPNAASAASAGDATPRTIPAPDLRAATDNARACTAVSELDSSIDTLKQQSAAASAPTPPVLPAKSAAPTKSAAPAAQSNKRMLAASQPAADSSNAKTDIMSTLSPEEQQRERERTRTFKMKPIPPEPAMNHDENKTLDMGPFHVNSMIRISSLQPVKLEASYNEPISLRDALAYALRNSLPIRISRESLNYQKWQLYGAVVSALPIPSFSTGLNLTNSDIINEQTFSNAKVFQTTVRYPVFTGGSAVFGFLAQYYREKGWKKAFYASINDALLDVYNKYFNLVLQNTLLQIRAKSLEVSETQLRLNDSLYMAGTGTQFAIMQSRTQLASDRQAMLQQQAAVRQASLALAFALNVPMAVNLVPQEEAISEQSLVNEHTGINDLLNVALINRPELRQYEFFRLAAARNVQVAAAPLYPSLSFFNTFTHSKTVVTPEGGNVNGVATAQIASASGSSAPASNNSLGQTASFSPTSSTTANTGASNTSNTSVVAASGGQPLNLVQSGSIVTSGATAPSFAGNSGGGSGTGFSTSNVNGSNTAGAGVFSGAFNTFQSGFSLSWSLSNMGLNNVANIVSARVLSRQALMQANQELLLVTEQVRADYLTALTSREQIDNAAYGAESAKEALRLANLRLRTGMGTNLELITAQRDYITALTTQAQAIISSNLAQAQLLHDMGVISLDSLTRGFHDETSSKRKAPKI